MTSMMMTVNEMTLHSMTTINTFQKDSDKLNKNRDLVHNRLNLTLFSD